jgi:hypothetical protein
MQYLSSQSPPRKRPVGRRIRFHHWFKPRRRPLVRVYRVEHLKIGGAQ